MFKHSIITCIAISALIVSGIFGCEGKTQKVDKSNNITSKKITNESSKKTVKLKSNKNSEIVEPKNETPSSDKNEINSENTVGSTESKDDIQVDKSEGITLADKSQAGVDKNINEETEDVDKRQAAEVLASLRKEVGVEGINEGNTLDSLKSPFLPLFKNEPTPRPDPGGIKKPIRVPVSPIEEVDLSQLKLVATLRAKSGNKALIEDSTGKGYIVKKGSYIGINQGSVIEISDEKVVVEEEIETMAGEVKVQRREMKLQKAPGE